MGENIFYKGGVRKTLSSKTKSPISMKERKKKKTDRFDCIFFFNVFPGRPVVKTPCFHCSMNSCNPSHAMWHGQKIIHKYKEETKDWEII